MLYDLLYVGYAAVASGPDARAARRPAPRPRASGARYRAAGAAGRRELDAAAVARAPRRAAAEPRLRAPGLDGAAPPVGPARDRVEAGGFGRFRLSTTRSCSTSRDGSPTSTAGTSTSRSRSSRSRRCGRACSSSSAPGRETRTAPSARRCRRSACRRGATPSTPGRATSTRGRTAPRSSTSCAPTTIRSTARSRRCCRQTFDEAAPQLRRRLGRPPPRRRLPLLRGGRARRRDLAAEAQRPRRRSCSTTRTSARPDFGVWRLWEELVATLPRLRVPARARPRRARGRQRRRRRVPRTFSTRPDGTPLARALLRRARKPDRRPGPRATATGRRSSASGAAGSAHAARARRPLTRREAERLRGRARERSRGHRAAAAESRTLDRARADSALERDRLETQLRSRAERGPRPGVIESPSWRLTAPLRRGEARPCAGRGVRRRRVPAARSSPRRPGGSAGSPASRLRRRRGAALGFRPLVSVVTPVYDIDPALAPPRRRVGPRARRTPHWQLCLADDGSTSERDARVPARGSPATRRSTSSSATRTAASPPRRTVRSGAAAGEFVAFLDHDDELAPGCAARVRPAC